jgi:hypothetical protein
MIKIDNSSFEKVEKFKCVGNTLTKPVLFRKKLRADWSQGMLVIILHRNFCLPVCYPKTQRLRYTEL